MSLITDYEERYDAYGYSTATYTIGSVHYEEIRKHDGTLVLFKCYYEGSYILKLYPSVDRYICITSGIDI